MKSKRYRITYYVEFKEEVEARDLAETVHDGAHRMQQLFPAEHCIASVDTNVTDADLSLAPPHPAVINLNGSPRLWPKPTIAYEDVVPSGRVLSVMWSGPRGSGGCLAPGESILAVDGLRISACDTSNA